MLKDFIFIDKNKKILRTMLPVLIIKRKIVSKNQKFIFKCVLSASYESFNVTFSIILKSNKPSLDLTFIWLIV